MLAIVMFEVGFFVSVDVMVYIPLAAFEGKIYLEDVVGSFILMLIYTSVAWR